LWLVARRLEIGCKTEGFAALGFFRPQGAVRNKLGELVLAHARFGNRGEVFATRQALLLLGHEPNIDLFAGMSSARTVLSAHRRVNVVCFYGLASLYVSAKHAGEHISDSHKSGTQRSI